MGDVLSQSEIDNLLSALSSGDIVADSANASREKAVSSYNFAKPAKFSKEQLRTLEIIYDHYGRLLSTHLPLHLRKNVQVDVASSEAVTYSEFANALSSPVLFGIIDMQPLGGSSVLSLDATLGFMMIDRMLGGGGLPLNRNREFSEIELTILERIFNICVELLIEPWANVAEINPKLERIETNSQFAQIYSPNEMTAVIAINVTMGGITGMITICMPYSCLEPVVDKLNTKFWYSSIQSKDEKAYNDVIETAISKAQIPVKVILGHSIISVNEFTTLQKGDIIKLDTSIKDELNVYVGNIHKFTAVPGAAKDTYAVKIKTVIREEQ